MSRIEQMELNTQITDFFSKFTVDFRLFVLLCFVLNFRMF